MKVLHIISGLKNGGAEAILFRVVSDASSNFQHEVISLSDEGYYGEIIASKGIKVTALNITSVLSIFRAFFKLMSLVRSAKPDIVQTWMYHADILGGLAAKLAGIKKICWGVHSTFLNPDETETSTKIAVEISRFLSYKIPTKIICCSDTALQSHKKLGYCSSKMIVVNNGFDTAIFKPDSVQRKLIRKSMGLDEHVFVLGMIARWDPVKDHETFLKAISDIKSSSFDWKCLLIGDGMIYSNEKLSAIIHHYGLENRVLCLGPQQNIPNFLNSLDLHILSSSAESFGNVTAEAMACSIPCLMTNVGEAKNMLSELGWVVPIRNSLRLSETINQIFRESRNHQKWSFRKALCRKNIEDNYSIEAMITAYAKVWIG